jgi:hypothetical protein
MRPNLAFVYQVVKQFQKRHTCMSVKKKRFLRSVSVFAEGWKVCLQLAGDVTVAV